MTTEELEKEVTEEFHEPTVGFAKFEKPGDSVTGTYVGKQNIPAKGIYKEQIAYNLLVNGNEVVVAFGIDKVYTHKCMKGAKIGQRVKFLFAEWFEQDTYKKELERVLAAGGKAEDCNISRSKSIKVLLGNMDSNYLDGFKEDGGGVSVDDIKM